MTVALGFNTPALGETNPKPSGGEPRDLEVELPAGLFGEPNSVRVVRVSCWMKKGARRIRGSGRDEAWDFDGVSVFPVYNMAPPPGVADEIALKFYGIPTSFDTAPRGMGIHRLITHVNDIPAVKLTSNILELWVSLANTGPVRRRGRFSRRRPRAGARGRSRCVR